MIQTLPSYGKWKAPAEDGQLLIWPEPGALLAQARENHERLGGASETLLQNVPLPEVRSAQRAWLGHGDDRLLFATGHQIELYHPGVWAKNVLIDAAASAVGGVACQVAVDTDGPKHLFLRWPGGALPLTDDERILGADWAGLVAPPSPAHLRQTLDRFLAAAEGWRFRPALPIVLQSMLRRSASAERLTDSLTEAMHELDWELGLRHHVLLASPIWQSPGYLLLVHHVLARTGELTGTYNEILDAYRREQGISQAGRPWPDLHCGEDGCEVPFWLDELGTGRRLRATVRESEEGWTLWAGEERFVFRPTAEGWEAADSLRRFLNGHGLRLSPRALMLTLFLRLLVADQFVHGIGGGIYDEVTDRFMAQFFGLEPPRFSVSTATLLFPDAVGRERVDVGAVHAEGRRLRHAWGDEEKRREAKAIGALPRHSPERRRRFDAMHERLARQAEGATYVDWRRRYDEALEQREREKTLFDRELFYAMQPVERLQGLIRRYRERVGG